MGIIPASWFRLSWVVIVFSVFTSESDARIVHVEISPKVVRQGDAFVIRVTGMRGGGVPTVQVARKAIDMSTCGTGCFVGIGAIALDEKPGRRMVEVKGGKGQRKKLWLTVRKGIFETIALTLPDEKVNLSPNDLAIVEEENAVLKSLFLSRSERRWQGAFRLPFDSTISMPFGAKRIMNGTWTSIHRGIDLKGQEGDSVSASNCGNVVLARELFFGGKTVILDHGQGIFTIYMHLSDVSVSVGDTVKKGDIIGRVGSTGRTTGPHLHFGVKVGDIPVNPISLMNLRL